MKRGNAHSGNASYRLLSKMRIGWRLAIAAAILLAPLTILGFVYVQSKIEAIHVVQLEKDGLAFLAPLGQFARHAAEHRGLTNVYLRGERMVLPKILYLARLIDRDIAQLHTKEAQLGDVLKTQDELTEIESAWIELRSNPHRLTWQDNFSRHTWMIRQALDLNALVAETSGLILDPRPQTNLLIEISVRQGAELAEKIGHLRGRSAGLVQAGTLNPAERESVLSEITNINAQFRAIKRSFAAVYRYAPALQAETDTGILDTEYKLRKFLGYVERMSHGEALGVGALQLFQIGTDALLEYNKLKDVVDGITLREMDRVIADLSREAWIAAIAVLGTILIAFIVAVISAQSVIGPVGHLARVVGRLAQGDNQARTGLNTGDEIGVLGRQFDKMMDERQRSEEQLAFLAQSDTLTGLPNRHMLHDRLTKALALSKHANARLGCMFVDLDRFKNVNDTFGHNVGDKLLIQVAERLRRCVQRNTDVIGRLGGDEFAIVLSNLSQPTDAGVVAQRIITALSTPFDLEGSDCYVSASIGIAVYPGDGEEADEMLKNADTAMYRAKDQGRSNFQYYVPEMNERAMQRMQIESSLRGALERREFLLHYQPKVDLGTGTVNGFEALLRWEHPQRGVVSPAEFVPALEDTGLIVPVGEWVLRTVCDQIEQWQAQGITPRPVSVNVSARQFQQKHLNALMQCIREAGIDPALIELELTESLLMQGGEEAIQTLVDLKTFGVRLSLDDFGTGYSSLSYLKRFPLDEIKIDRAFIRDVTADTADAEITLAVISLAHSLSLKVIAEGVETEDQLNFLKLHSCDKMQGYYFSRPVGIGECTQMLREDRRLKVSSAGETTADSPVVLLVDDNRDYLTLIHKVLERDGFHVLEADNPRTAFELLIKHSVKVVISDHFMPDMTGVKFLAKVRKLYPRAVRIMMSGVGDAEAVTDAVNEAGVHKYVSKSWDAARLCLAVREAYRGAA